jgi:predicted enzyme related to lactoylglutathione lyase
LAPVSRKKAGYTVPNRELISRLLAEPIDGRADMITGVHTMFYTADPEADRAFLRDVLEMPATDVGEGWLIFDMPDAEMGFHPLESQGKTIESGTPDISFYCDDIHATVARLKERGVKFVDEIVDAGYGYTTHFRMPGGYALQLYQPRYSRSSSSRK